MTKYITIFITLVACILGAFRTSGLDYETYLNEYIDPDAAVISYEIGYKWLLDITRPLGNFSSVLLIADLIFVLSHWKIICRIDTKYQFIGYVSYLFYIFVFLIYGSPRRLIAYSLVAYQLIYWQLKTNQEKKFTKNLFAAMVIAPMFHLSALLGVAFSLYEISKTKQIKNGMTIAVVICFIAFVLSLQIFDISSIFEYINYKIQYYMFDAFDEQDYLSEVPSVYSGLTKRLLATLLIWFGLKVRESSIQPIKLCLFEALIYFAFGLFSPVLAMLSSYFVLSYLFPLLNSAKTASGSTHGEQYLAIASMLFFVPTSVGLLSIFWNYY